MTAKYAIVYPAWEWQGDGCADMTNFITYPFLKCLSQQVCGYSLGFSPKFFDTLEEAQKQFSVPELQFQYGQYAIIAFEEENGRVTELTKLLEVQSFQKLYERASEYKNNLLFKPVVMPKWKERDIVDGDCSPKALAKFNQHYAENLQLNSLRGRA